MEVAGCGEGDPDPPSSYPAELGLRRFSFCLRLQNQTLTTSRSMFRLSDTKAISSPVGFGFWLKARSSAIRIVVSIEVRFFLRLVEKYYQQKKNIFFIQVEMITGTKNISQMKKYFMH